MKPHEERVVTEKRELDEKLEKLRAFCFDGSPIFKSLPSEDQNLLLGQYDAMVKYSSILAVRIERFPKE